MNDARARLLTADLLDPGLGEPLADGGVLVESGVVRALGPAAELRARFPHAPEERVGRAIAPPPANAHTHLDLSRVPFRALVYDRWVLEHMGAHLHLAGRAGAELGLGALRAANAAAFGDITEEAEVVEFLLREADLPGVVYWQVFDPNPATADATFRRTVERVKAWRRLERPGGPRLGLSPHATYTVSHRLHRLVADFARAEGLPLQIHAAEAPTELQMFRAGDGPLAEKFLHAMAPLTLEDVFGRGPDPALTPVTHLAELGVLDARPTLVHVANVTEDDVRTLAAAGCAVVTCPRSNAALECGEFDWALFARYGVTVGLGTDSVASGETLDPRDELAFLRRARPDVPDAALVGAASRGGRRLLGVDTPALREGGAWNDAWTWAR